MLKLAMCLKAARSDETVLTVDDMALAVQTLEGIEEGMMIAYQAIAFSSIEAVVEKVLTMLKSSKDGFLTHREVMRRILGYKGFGGKGIDEVLEYMVKSGLLHSQPHSRGSTAYRIKMVGEEDDDEKMCITKP
jgi:hypothetical protein